MCKRVNVKFTPDIIEGEHWYMKHEWTVAEMYEFQDWLAIHLFNNANARKLIMEHPIKDAKHCRDTANWFVLNYGWKQK